MNGGNLLALTAILLEEEKKRKIQKEIEIINEKELQLMNNDEYFHNKSYYGLINYTIDKHGRENSKILFIDENKNVMMSHVADFYNNKLKCDYGNMILYKVKNVNPHLISVNLLKRLSNEISQYILLESHHNKQYYFWELGKIKMQNLNDIINMKNKYSNKKFGDDKLESIMYDTFASIRRTTILRNIKYNLEQMNNNTIKIIFEDIGHKYRWCYFKSCMIEKIMDYVKNIQ